MEQKHNVNYDFGHLLVNDTKPFSKDTIDENDIISRGKDNTSSFFASLFQLSKVQKGEDQVDRDFSKAKDNISLPKPQLLLPRSLPIPKPKPLSKWEKFKKEKGFETKKRSRMVYSEIAGDWVPRWGKGSSKKIEQKADWIVEDKDANAMQEESPFDEKKNKKKLEKLKQEKRELKNETPQEKMPKVGKKSKKQFKAERELKRIDQDKKELNKTLEKVQKSTASMGNFDKKLKHEKEINKIKKKKVDPSILLNRKQERDRDNMIMDTVLKKIKK